MSLGQIAGRPAELVIAAVLFLGAGIYLLVDSLLTLGDVFDIFDISTRFGLFFLFSVISTVIVGFGLAGIAWLLANADPRGRILAVVVGLAWAIAMIASKFRYFVPEIGESPGTSLSLILGLIAVLLGAALTFLPGAHTTFKGHPAAATAGISASRLALAVVALIILIQGTFLLVAAVGETGKETANGIILILTGLGVGVIAQLLPTRRMELRLALSGLALAVFITALILGPRYFVTVFALSVILLLPFVLWLVSDARTFFGERPISFGSLVQATGQAGGGTATAGGRPFSRPAAGSLVCTNCGATLQEGDAFCSSCGTPVPEPEPEPQTRSCGTCGREVEAGAAFCPACGTKMEDVTASQPPPPSVCGTCGATVEPGSRFCGSCGSPVGGAQ